MVASAGHNQLGDDHCWLVVEIRWSNLRDSEKMVVFGLVHRRSLSYQCHPAVAKKITELIRRFKDEIKMPNLLV